MMTPARRNKLRTLLWFVLMKWTATLVIVNFYLGSMISLEEIENSVLRLMQRDRFVTFEQPESDPKAHQNRQYKADKQPPDVDEVMGRTGTMSGVVTPTKLVRDITPNLKDGTLQGRERLWEMLTTRNMTQVDAEYWSSIPTWDEILDNIKHSGDRQNALPIIHGLDTCQAFQNKTSSDPSQRRIAPAGLFNSGTNLLSVLLEFNCQNPNRVKKFKGNAKRGHGNEWEVPWGKHTPGSERGQYLKNQKIKYTIDEVLPVVLIRNPYGWMKSMCRHPYTAKWGSMQNKRSCPELKRGGEWNGVEAKFGSGVTHHKSLAHMYNDWYGHYYYGSHTAAEGTQRSIEAPFPRLIVRFEDIIFFPLEVTTQICNCAGGVIGHREDDRDVPEDKFHFVVRSAKQGTGHGPKEKRNGLIDSWQRYGSRSPRSDYSQEELQVANAALDLNLLGRFQYG